MENAKQLLAEIGASGCHLYLRNNWITTRDRISEEHLIRLSKCAGEMRALLKDGSEFGQGVNIGPVSGHESEYWGIGSKN